MNILLDYNLEELEKLVSDLGQPKYRAKQLQDGLLQGKVINEISTLSKELKSALLSEYIAQPLTILTKKISQDGTIKFIFRLRDENLIESVLLKYKYGYTLCVSTQVGCKMRCSFCASGYDGFVRNLSAGEILAQVVQANRFLEGGIKEDRKIINIVLMGSGEPLDNYQNVMKFLKLVTTEFGVSERNISLSTCGLVPQIRKLANENLKITLTISLHASNDELRKSLMPIANTYALKQLMNAVKYYFTKTKRRVVFEYIIIPDVNDNDINLYELKSLLKGFSYHLNLIPYNDANDMSYDNDEPRIRANIFAQKLQKMDMSCTVRRSLGDDIEGACGQLKRKWLKDNEEN